NTARGPLSGRFAYYAPPHRLASQFFARPVRSVSSVGPASGSIAPPFPPEALPPPGPRSFVLFPKLVTNCRPRLNTPPIGTAGLLPAMTGAPLLPSNGWPMVVRGAREATAQSQTHNTDTWRSTDRVRPRRSPRSGALGPTRI